MQPRAQMVLGKPGSSLQPKAGPKSIASRRQRAACGEPDGGYAAVAIGGYAEDRKKRAQMAKMAMGPAIT